MGARIYLDISRLLSAGRRTTPSGIERVELAYAGQFGRIDGTRFVAFFLGRLHLLPCRFALAYIETLENAWRGSSRVGGLKSIIHMGYTYFVLLAMSACVLLRRQRQSKAANSVYLNLSHQNLTAPKAIADFRSRTGARLLFFVHDLIPITYPEYARPGQARMHRRRMDTVAALADAILVNSAATKDEFLHDLKDKPPVIHVVHLGIVAASWLPVDPGGDDNASVPYFLIVATVEPRKNHLLLLNLWRRLAAEAAPVPRLIIAGRRGWENEMVLDMLERCDAIAGLVEERRDVGDAELGPLMRGARAVLLPSFAEGYGLPVAEALATGTPVICSDLPALREIGLDVPEYLDPMDGPAWRQAILDYAQAASPRRAAQCERLLSWSPPRWDRHFQQVSAIIDGLVKADHRAR